MSSNPIFNYDEEKPSFAKKYGLGIGLAVLAIAGVGLAYYFVSQKGSGPAPKQETVMIRALPPPPPQKAPPPPKQEPMKVKEEMVEQTPVDEAEEKPADEAPADPGISTGLTGPGGPDGFGLSKSGSGGNRIGGRKGSGSKFGWYAAQVQKRISQAVQDHPKARYANGVAKVRIWADAGGRVTKAKLVETTGDKAMDELLCSEVLAGLVLAEPPPSDLPQPITLRIAMRRPN
ncbi:TonB C-terminal domain-containing protein [Nibricoccus sp. IMCC34717]|uniref:TonB C-terminal domain-containing protein n=1 Tax=Nibricoccus sp. IMCC34717 TaxID=3034021 RepID=UPI0038515655